MTPARRAVPAQRSKYGAKPQVVDGIRFASQKEARRYGELKLLEKAGDISALQVQPSFALSVPWYQGPRGQNAVIGEYRADFSYRQHEGLTSHVRVEDVKGFKTPLYKWKKKHVEAQYGVVIREI